METKPSCIIGSTGFVGGTLQAQASFDGLFSSRNISDIGNLAWGTVVCAAAPAQKWLANKEPEADFLNLQNLWKNIETISATQFILISTVDVFEKPVNVDESSTVGINTGAYGRNRFWLETQVRKTFDSHLIVRLPGLVGTGLRKNIIYDFKNHNNVEAIDRRSSFQFYPMKNLWKDIQIAAEANLELVHLTAVPIKTSRVAELAGYSDSNAQTASEPVSYDFRTIHSRLWGREDSYQYSLKDTEQAIEQYLAGADGS